MSKNKKLEIIDAEIVETPEVSAPAEEVKPFEFKNKAYGIHQIREGTDIRYALIEIGYDPETGDVSPIKMVAKDYRDDTIDKFKQLAADLFILNN